MPPPKHDLREFLDACLAGGQGITLLAQARKDADIFYKLKSQQAVISFIANGGMESPRKFLDSLPIRDLKGLEGQLTDAYEFAIHGKKGYISLFKSSRGGWVIKSFHPQWDHRPAGNMTEDERRKFGYNGYEQQKRNLGGKDEKA